MERIGSFAYRKAPQSPHDIPPSTKRPHRGRSRVSAPVCTTKCYLTILAASSFSMYMGLWHVHRLPSQGVNNLLQVKVLFSLRIFLEKLAGPMSEKLVVSYLQLEGARVPSIIQSDIIRVNEGEFLICKKTT